MTISAGQIQIGIKTFEKYQQDFTNPELQLELVTIYVTEKSDVIKLKDEEFMTSQKDRVFSELDSEVYDQVLDFFPLIVAKSLLKSLGLKPEEIETRISKAKELAESQREIILQGLQTSQESLQDTQEV